MKIVAYCRVSTDSKDQLNSLKTQKEFFENYARENSYELVRIYADEGISGTKTRNRKQFLKLLEDAKNNQFEKVVVKDVSRFARNTVDVLNSTRMLKNLNIDTVFLSTNTNSLEQSEFLVTLFAALAQEESMNLSKRVKFTKHQNSLKGKVPNICYGYDKIIGDIYNLNINVYEAKIINDIFYMYVTDNMKIGRIVKELNDNCIKTKRNKMWSQGGVLRILKNNIYIGEIINEKEYVADILTGRRNIRSENDWIKVKNESLRIVENNIFEKANLKLKIIEENKTLAS